MTLLGIAILVGILGATGVGVPIAVAVARENGRRRRAVAARRPTLVRTFRFGTGVPAVLAGGNPVAELRRRAAAELGEPVDIFQLTDVLHETIPEPGEGTLSAGVEHVDVLVGAGFVTLTSGTTRTLLEAIAAVLVRLGGVEDQPAGGASGSTSRFRRRAFGLVAGGRPLPGRLLLAASGPDGTLVALDRQGRLLQRRGGAWTSLARVPLEPGQWASALWIGADAEPRVTVGHRVLVREGGRFREEVPTLSDGRAIKLLAVDGVPPDLLGACLVPPAMKSHLVRSEDGASWQAVDALVPHPAQLDGLRRPGKGRSWAFGDRGALLRQDARGWCLLATDSLAYVHDVLDVGTTALVAGDDLLRLVDEQGQMEDVRWREPTGFAGGEVDFRAAWGTGPADLWVAGYHDHDVLVVLRYDGASWTGGDVVLGSDDLRGGLWLARDGRETLLLVDDGRVVRIVPEPKGV